MHKRKEVLNAENNPLHGERAGENFPYNEVKISKIQRKISDHRGRSHQTRSGKNFAQHNRKINTTILQ
jgi:hypothetical protein